MAQVASKGLARAGELYQNRDMRARELNAEGKQVIGYLCLYPVIELITAFDMVPYRIFGDMDEAITEADTFLPANCCSFLRSCLDLGMKGKYDFLTGTIFAHICEVGQRIHQMWRIAVNMPFTHYIDTPHVVRPETFAQHKDLIRELQESLEAFTGKKLSREKLNEAIKIHNEQRVLVRKMYDLKKQDPPLISGTETLKVLKAVMSLPIDEGNQLLQEVIAEVKERKDGPVKKSARLLIWGPVVDYAGFPEMIESLDANIVMDDTCVGSRPFFQDVEVGDDPLAALSKHYLDDVKCARTVRESEHGAVKKDNKLYQQSRFGFLESYIKDWKVDGVIIETMRYCDAHGYEIPVLMDYLDDLGIPHLELEQDYSDAALAPMRTRVQGFIEVVVS